METPLVEVLHGRVEDPQPPLVADGVRTPRTGPPSTFRRPLPHHARHPRPPKAPSRATSKFLANRRLHESSPPPFQAICRVIVATWAIPGTHSVLLLL